MVSAIDVGSTDNRMVVKAAPTPQIGAEHPQREHVDQEVTKAPGVVEEHVGHRLPDRQLAEDGCGYQPEPQRHRRNDHVEQEHGDVDANQHLDCWRHLSRPERHRRGRRGVARHLGDRSRLRL
jgi:hypothetical protein